MPVPTLVSTAGAADANTYASLEEYKSYISVRRPQLDWFATALSGTTLDEQLAIDLIYSRHILDSSFNWTGTISTANLSESLLWPREGMYYRNGKAIPSTVNPVDLKNAQCELAVQIHSTDLISDNEVQKQGIVGVKAGSVEVEFQERDLTSLESSNVDVIRRGSEFNYLSDSVPRMVRLLLVSSWYREAEVVKRGLVFEVM